MIQLIKLFKLIQEFDIIRKNLMRIDLLSGERYRYKLLHKINIV